MNQQNIDKGTEWIFCRNLKGECSGLSPHTKVLEKKPREIKIHGKTVQGWEVRIISEQSEGHVDWDMANMSDE